MESANVQIIPAESGTGLQLSAEPTLSRLSASFAARGLAKSVLDEAAQQIKKEEETRALSPDAYRLSLLSEAALIGRYRKGKETMSASDVIGYFNETRMRRISNVDFSENTGVEVEESEASNAQDAAKPIAVSEPTQHPVRTLSRTVGKRILSAAPHWFNSQKADTSREVRRFPLSAFAAILAVAMSLMLIVASSVMLTRAENNINQLKQETNALSGEINEMISDFQTRHDLLEIRRIAIEELGMVEEDYLRMQYLSLKSEESVEVYGEKREETVNLSSILSAIGIK